MQHRIVVLGGGYTGTVAAGRLAKRLRREDVSITLVNPEPDFVERVRLHQLAAGQDLAPRPFAEIFAGTGVELRLGRVTHVDVDTKTVTTTAPDGTGSDVVEYDTLVYALRSGWDVDGVPGVAEHAHDVSSRPGALRLRERLAALEPGSRVVVVGGGLAGLETMTEVAEAHPGLDVALVARGGLGDWLSEKGRAHLRTVVDRLGITVHEHASVAAVGPDGVTTAGGTVLPADVTVWTAGFAVHPLARATALETTDRGQIVVDATMRSVSHPDVYAVGDAASAMGPGGKPLRMSCASGTPTAWQAADAVAARLSGGEVPRVGIRYVQQCISLGRSDGLIQFVTADDRSKDRALSGRVAVLYKELITRSAVWAVAHPTMGVPSRRRRVVRSAARADRRARPPADRTPGAARANARD
ncbi:NADH dehydrogenase FAD-containing subunit [Cellulosimicrobium cellulans J34]|nr:NADH dehydrogenase FAD-containing subunit [Cellulosimicrobium cellulans J34]SMF35739.1 NADH dehydrogenase, FAD-containing subunit [Cellulosimicrobium cellulans J1]